MVSSSPHRAAAVAHLAAITIQLWTATGGQEIQYEPPNLSDTTRISQDIGASRGASDCSQTGGARFPKALPSTIPCRHTAGAAQSPPSEPPRWQDCAAAPGTGPASTRRWTPHPRLTNTHWTAGPKALAPRWGLSPQNQQMFPNAWWEEPQELNLEQALPALASSGVPATDGLTD